MMERLQKIIARSGYCSRRKAEELIASGAVSVNGEVVTKLGTKASVNDIITVNGKQIYIQERVYLVLNKPRGVVSTVSDEKGRPTVISILSNEYQNIGLYPVGRLDYDTKGVLLLTNDGEFMNELVGPNSNIEKEYLVRLNGIISKEELRAMQYGVVIDGYKTRRCRTYFSSADTQNNSCLVGIVLKEGKYHQVKKMFESVGYPVKRLTRIRFGEITLEGLGEGEVRKLTPHEIKRLYVLSK
jgi:23S rRNA pseudouridine2605 synthase